MRILAAALILISAGCGPFASYTPVLKPYRLEGSDFFLASRLRLFFQEDHSQPTVSVATVVDAGATADPPGKEGLAHLVEHMVFRASHGEGRNVWQHLRLLGARASAATSHDVTTYNAIGHREALPALLEIEAQRLLDPLAGVTEEMLAIEREVVRNELRQRFEISRTASAANLIGRLLYPEGHPYHRSVIGSHESLARITLDDMQAFVDAHYRPEKTTVVVVGDFDRANAASLIDAAFPASLRSGGKRFIAGLDFHGPPVRVGSAAPEVPPPNETGIQRIAAGVATPVVLLAWSVPGAYRDEDLMALVAAQFLEGAIETHRVGAGLRYEARIEDASCDVHPAALASTVVCTIEPAEGRDPAKVAQGALAGLQEQWDLKGRGWRSRALFRLKTAAAIDTYMDASTLERASYIAEVLHRRASPNVFSNRFAQITSIRENALRGFGFTYLNRERAVQVIVEPYATADTASSGPTLDYAADWSGALQSDRDALSRSAAELTPERAEAVTVASGTTSMREFLLPNGMRVVLRRQGAVPYVMAGLLLGGGTHTTQPPFALALAGLKTETRDPVDVAGSWGSARYPDGELVSVTVPAANLPAAMDLLLDHAESATSAWTLSRRRSVEEWAEEEDAEPYSLEARLWERLAAALFEGHPLGRSRPDLSAFAEVSGSFMDDLVYEHVAPANATLLVVGDMELDAAERVVREFWSTYRDEDPGRRQDGLPPAPKPPAPLVVLADQPAATQTRVTVACQLAPPRDPSGVAGDVLESLVEEDLTRTIREQAGVSYGVHVAVERFAGGVSRLIIESAIATSSVGRALHTIVGRLRALGSEPPSAEHVNLARWRVASDSHVESLGLERTLEGLASAMRTGGDVAVVSERPGRLTAVTGADVSELLERCANHEVVGVLGPAPGLERVLGELEIRAERLSSSK